MTDFFNQIFQSADINTPTTIFRIVLSFFAGAIIGFERVTHRSLNHLLSFISTQFPQEKTQIGFK